MCFNVSRTGALGVQQQKQQQKAVNFCGRWHVQYGKYVCLWACARCITSHSAAGLVAAAAAAGSGRSCGCRRRSRSSQWEQRAKTAQTATARLDVSCAVLGHQMVCILACTQKSVVAAWPGCMPCMAPHAAGLICSAPWLHVHCPAPPCSL
jgi:hypothetical protein